MRLPAGNSASASTITNFAQWAAGSSTHAASRWSLERRPLYFHRHQIAVKHFSSIFKIIGLSLFCLESSSIPLQIPEAWSCFVHPLGHATEGMGFPRYRSAGRRCVSCKQECLQQQVCQSVVLATRSPLDPHSARTLFTYAYCHNNLYMFPVRQTGCSVGCNMHIPQMFRVGLGRHHLSHFSALITSYYIRVSPGSYLAANGKSSDQETGGGNFFVIGENVLIIFDGMHS